MSGGSNINTSQDPDYVGPTGHEKKFHKTHFEVVKEKGGNERVKVKTKDGFTFVSLAYALEEGLEIIPNRDANKRRKSVEVDSGISANEPDTKHI